MSIEKYIKNEEFLLKVLQHGELRYIIENCVDWWSNTNNDLPGCSRGAPSNDDDNDSNNDMEFVQHAITISTIDNLVPFYMGYLPDHIKDNYDIAKQVLIKLLVFMEAVENANGGQDSIDNDDSSRSSSASSKSTATDAPITSTTKAVTTSPMLKNELIDVILEITNRVPRLLGDRQVMLSFTKNAHCKDIYQETLQFSPLDIRNDKQIMLQAVAKNAEALEYIIDDFDDNRIHHNNNNINGPHLLQNDYDILMAAIKESPTSLHLVSHSFQYDHPEIVLQAIKGAAAIDPTDLWSLYDDINEDLWFDRKDVAMAWLQHGGEWLDDEFPEDYCDDKELMLTVAEYNWREFDRVSDSLRSDREFMLKAVAKDGRVLNEACDALRHDYDLALIAFSNSCYALHHFDDEEGEDFEFLVSISKRVRHRLAEYDVFMKQVLCAMECKRPDCDPGCCLSMLNQGPDTSLGYKRLIASYLGVPGGLEIDRLRIVSRNLLHWGF